MEGCTNAEHKTNGIPIKNLHVCCGHRVHDCINWFPINQFWYTELD